MTISIPVKFTGLPYHLVSTTELPDHVNVTMEAKGFVLLWYQWIDETEKVEVPLDLSHTHPVNGQYYRINLNNYITEITQSFNNNVRIRKVQPDTFSITLTKRKTKKVPVMLQTELDFEHEFGQSGPPIIQPDSILISGPEQNIGQIKSINTEWIKEKRLNKKLEKSVSLKSVYGITLQTNEVRVSIPVEQFTEKTVEATVSVLETPEGAEINLIPAKIKLHIFVPISLFNSISEEQFRIAVVYPGTETKVKKLIPQVIQKPDYIKILSIDPPIVEYILKQPVVP